MKKVVWGGRLVAAVREGRCGATRRRAHGSFGHPDVIRYLDRY